MTEQTPTTAAGRYWTCKIGPTDAAELPPGSDLPMRQAVRAAFVALTGHGEQVLSSGWGRPEAADLARRESGEAAGLDLTALARALGPSDAVSWEAYLYRQGEDRGVALRPIGFAAWVANEYDRALAAAPAPAAPTPHSRFDHDGTYRHHHDADTGEPIWWLNCEQFGGEKRLHRHEAPAAPPPPTLDREQARDAVIAAARELQHIEYGADGVSLDSVTEIGCTSTNFARFNDALAALDRLPPEPGA